MQHISLLIKPASGNCNLRCKYCFYHDIISKREKENYGIMPISLLEKIVKKALSEAEEMCTFSFQGGEPTLVGLEFYKKLIEFQTKHNKSNIKIENSIQTNGMLIDEDWAAFLAESDFLVGISLDGSQSIHDMHRQDADGNGSYSRVMKTIRLFDKYSVKYNILCVVTNHAARHADKIYNFYKKNNFAFLQFIPCLDPLGEKRGQKPYSLNPNAYANFLKTLFDRWYADFKKGNYISIRQFDEYIRMIAGYPPHSCGMSGICTCYFVIEADGSVYPCDFYVLDEWKIGNVKHNNFTQMINSENAKKFIQISTHIDEKCKECKVLKLCRGGCRRDREPIHNDKPLLNYFCEAYKEFFYSSASRMIEIAKNIT